MTVCVCMYVCVLFFYFYGWSQVMDLNVQMDFFPQTCVRTNVVARGVPTTKQHCAHIQSDISR